MDACSNGNQLFSNNSHILDNSAYPLKDWLLTPYQRNRHLSGYNYKYGDQKGIQHVERDDCKIHIEVPENY